MSGQRLTGSRAWLAKVLGDLRASYWAVPGLCLVGAHLLAALTLLADRHHPELAAAMPTAFPDMQAAGARGLLTLMASSVIGVAGVMFSMTMVAVSFASGNFGPRLIGNFMRDRGTQWSLGILVGTFAFCLQILRAVQPGSNADGFLPSLSLNAALWLTLISTCTMVYFVHHVPEIIKVSNIAAALGRRLETCLREEIGAAPSDAAWQIPAGDPVARPSLGRSGYVQTLDTDRLQDIADCNQWRLRLCAQPGDFVAAGMPVLEVFAEDGARAPDDRDHGALCACFAIGDERTENQDLTFLVDQLVEMTARALSSGVNDPFTACDCLNRMYAALDVLLTCPTGAPQDEYGQMGRNRTTFCGLLERSFAASCPYIVTDRMVCDHASVLVARLRASARTDRDIEALDRLAEGLNGAKPA
ncbi:DUF2254 domain-containing protein [Tropicimonas sp. TH_r6]|uniref:DUF2254 domain-containing protein n=1 Tax=Tropicimonas sp. TH_r6 TaxID=3082085 RepID=UPI002954673F|nr:DUF2254 domain-containing protein [Tropicimonas sp. TH_r6]MDV7142032.1 DUF2254 domain-containing protein [Tropicimonas sp. TH_r6]